MFRLVFLWYLCLGISHTLCVDILTEYGPVRGRTTEVYNGQNTTTVDEFRGIPFGKDTSGLRRFANPEPPDPWVDVFEAFEPGDSCPQDMNLLRRTNPTWDRLSEDCLNLDIYTPDALSGPNTYPVMVWLYGGAYQIGANIQYPGHFLATHGVVVVVLNYRVGKLGFAFTGNDACPGNAGLWDQKMGLEFVINNIANFGGDPNRITVFGESAGAGSTALLMLSPETKDLFQQAILDSGAERNFWVHNKPETHPEDYIRQVAAQLDCLADDDFAMMDCLRGESFESIIDNSTVTCSPGYICLGMAPVVDGIDGFLPKTPKALRADGDVMRGPIVSGIMSEDGSIFAPVVVPGPMFSCCNRSRFEDALLFVVEYFSSRFDNQTQIEAFEALNWKYTHWPYINENDQSRDGLVKMITDAAFGAPWDIQLKQHHDVADSYGFVFQYQSKNSTVPDWMGVPHGGEVPYLWGVTLLQYNEHIANDSYMRADYYNEEDIEYTVYLQELMTNFAKYGNPTFVDVEKPFGGRTVWPKFDTDDYSVLFLGNDEIEPVREYRQKEYAFWSDYMNYIAYEVESAAIDGPDTGEFPSQLMSPIVASQSLRFLEVTAEDAGHIF